MTAVLALQGAFAEHEKMLSRLGEESFEIRQKKDLDRPFDRLIIPGGESTVMGKLINELGLFDSIKSRIESGMPVFGTCAGLILLAAETSDSNVYLGTMSIKAERNAYGRQLGSFYTEESFADSGKIPMTFIRAPYISEIYNDAKILAKADGKIVAAQQKNMLVTAFHPELGTCTKVHEYFLGM